jgi:hypothetical protein
MAPIHHSKPCPVILPPSFATRAQEPFIDADLSSALADSPAAPIVPHPSLSNLKEEQTGKQEKES